MSGPSSSQETELEYVFWQLPELPPVAVLRRVQDGLHQEVNDAFAAAPHLGPETGGILLGRHEEDRIIVEDFEPVPCDHQFGPSYRLSEGDREMLRETLEWFRGGAQPGLTVLGFYRSHTQEDFGLCHEDEELMRTHFAPAERLVVLIKPSLMGSSAADFFIDRYRPAERRDALSHLAAAEDAAKAGGRGSQWPTEWPSPRPRMGVDEETEAPEGRARVWYIAAAALGLAGGALGYLSLHPQAPPARATAANAKLAAPAPRVAGTEAAVEGAPAPAGPDMAGIHGLLDRWAAALKKGDAPAAAQCYAPVVSTYFARHQVSREAVRQSLQSARARYGRLDLYRISDLGITPVSESRAVATFRKRWRTAGRVRSAGEEEERMTLVRNQGAWQISSEQTEPR